jgi:hypothetical protein
VTLHGGDPDPANESLARHREAHPGRMRRLYALLVVLVMAGAIGWHLWRASDSDPDEPGVSESTVRTAKMDSPIAHQRTVVTFVSPDTIRVVEHLTYTTPTDEVELTNPEHLGAAAGFSPVIKGLWVDGGDGPDDADSPVSGGDPVTVHLAAPASEITVGYRATSVVQPTPGPVNGRALALVTPLRPAAAPGLREVEVNGVWVDNLGCLDEEGAMAACGTGTPLGWETTSQDSGLTDVVAQLTLPTG